MEQSGDYTLGSQTILQFFHPRVEHKIDFFEKQMGIKVWNSGNHKRKFIKSQGKYISSLTCNNLISDQLLFWGEWEPESYIKKINYPKELSISDLYPKFLHEPFYTNNPSAYYLQNTDPFVFGMDIYYCCCRQELIHKNEKIGFLKKGSIILFGSGINFNRKNDFEELGFVLDTVFVVDKRYIYNKNSLLKAKAINGKVELGVFELDNKDQKIACTIQVPKTYYECTLSKLKLKSEEELVLYIGANHKNPLNGMFSFFLCVLEANHKHYRKFILPNGRFSLEKIKCNTPAQNCKFFVVKPNLSNEEYFRDIINYAIGEGYKVGVEASMPKKDSKINYWQGEFSNIEVDSNEQKSIIKM